MRGICGIVSGTFDNGDIPEFDTPELILPSRFSRNAGQKPQRRYFGEEHPISHHGSISAPQSVKSQFPIPSYWNLPNALSKSPPDPPN